MKLNEIRLVEIELYSQCNRQCEFCPNSYIDRHSCNNEMTDEIFMKVIDELVEADYKGHISFSRYNEPFMHPEILRKRVDYIKQRLPDAKLVTNTNGDYDTNDFRNDIEITEMDYDGNKECYTKFMNGLTDEKSYRVMRLGPINNRGEALDLQKQVNRTKPCLEPTYFIGIDYEGSVVPCCNFRHDIESHKPYVFGNIKESKLEEILNSERATKFRKDTKEANFPDVCKTCTKEEGRYTRDCPRIE